MNMYVRMCGYADGELKFAEYVVLKIVLEPRSALVHCMS